jgi:hypothetical protein
LVYVDILKHHIHDHSRLDPYPKDSHYTYYALTNILSWLSDRPSIMPPKNEFYDPKDELMFALRTRHTPTSGSSHIECTLALTSIYDLLEDPSSDDSL